MATLDTREGRLDVLYRPGQGKTIIATWPSSLEGRTFEVTFGDTTLNVSVAGAVMTITATGGQLAEAVNATEWELVETTAGDVLVWAGKWVPSTRGNSGDDLEVTVFVDDPAVAVTVVGYGPGPGGGGAVDSVNGQTGVVVLDAGDVGADPAGTAAGLVATEAAARAAADASLDTRVDALEVAPPLHAATHENGGTDELALDASQITTGTLDDARIPSGIARDSEVTAAVSAEAATRAAADTALDTRVDALEVAPPAHAASHQDGGSDELALDGSQITTGTVADARVASTIARDSEVSAAIAASEAGQVRDGDTAGGVLSGTYPNPGFAVDMATQAELDAHVNDTADAHDASAISFTPAGTLAATDVQAAIEEAAAEAGGGQVDSVVAGTNIDVDATDPANPIVSLETLVDADIPAGIARDAEVAAGYATIDEPIAAAHIADTSDAHDAAAISIADPGNDFTATDVEGALAELQADHEADATALTDHAADTTSVHGIDDTSLLVVVADLADYLPLAGGEMTGTDPAPVDNTLGVLYIPVPDLNTNGIVVKVPSGTPTYGEGQALLIVEEGAGDAQDVSAAGSVLARINEHGSFGTQGGIHIATGARKPSGLAGSTSIWLTPEVDVVGMQIALKQGVATLNAFEVFGVAAPQAGVRAHAITKDGAHVWYGDNGTTVVAAIYPQTTAPVGARAILGAGAAASIPLLIQGAAAQSGDLLRWVDSASATLGQINSVGELLAPRGALSHVGYGFLADPNTGLYSSGADAASLVAGGVARATVDANGLTIPTTGGWLAATGAAFGVSVFVQGPAATDVGILARAHATQSVSIQEWQSSAGTMLSKVNKGGYHIFRLVAAPADGDLSANDLTFWLDNSAGAPTVRAKMKDSGGTVSNQTLLSAAVAAATYQPLDSDLTDLASRWAAASAAGPATLDFREDTDNGTNRARIAAPSALGADRALTLPDADGTFALIDTGAYGAGWNGSTKAPTQDAVYDKIETLSGGGGSEGLDSLTAFNALYGTGITAYDQEFSAVGSSLPSGWSWFNQGAASYAEQLGAGIITHVAGTGNQWRGVVQALPSESSWTAYARVSGTTASSESYVGLILTDGTKVIQLALYSTSSGPFGAGSGNIYIDRWTNSTTYSAAITSWSVQDWPRYFRIKRNSATSYDFAASMDGLTWITLQSGYDVSAFMTPTHIGMGGNIKTNRADQTAIHWFRVR